MSASVITKARSFINHLVSLKKFDTILSAVEPVGGKLGNVVYEMRVEAEHTNAFDTLHGGASAYLVDACSTVSQLTLDKPPGMLSSNVFFVHACKKPHLC